MPTYEYSCDFCRTITEEVHSIKNIPEVVVCKKCGGAATRILSMFAPRLDTPQWLDQGVRDAVQKDGEPPIETRTQLNEYCKRNDIIQTG